MTASAVSSMTTRIASTCPPRIERKAVSMGRHIAAAIERVRGRKYRVQQSVGLYPTAASTDDYAYSRHMVDPQKGKIIAFTMEWGRSRVLDTLPSAVSGNAQGHARSCSGSAGVLLPGPIEVSGAPASATAPRASSVR